MLIIEDGKLQPYEINTLYAWIASSEKEEGIIAAGDKPLIFSDIRLIEKTRPLINELKKVIDKKISLISFKRAEILE